MSQAVDEDRDELARFREEWKKEVERKKNPQPEPGPSKQRPELNVLAEYDLSETTSSGTATPGPSSETISGTPAALATASKYFDASNVPPAIRTALTIYTRAVQHEQSGQLDTALSLYRQAFRLEPNVDRAYQTQEILASIKAAQSTDLSSPKDEENIEHLATTLQRAVAIKSGEEPVLVVTGTLASLLEGFPQDLVFEPEDEKQPVYINVLPEELLIIILRKLDHTSIERFAAVSRKARVLSLDPGIWRELVVLSYKPPQVPSLESMVPVVAQFQSDFRRVYMEHPRVRLDGVYIAVCHYVRPGLSENSWVNLSHLITYHRYLRFFPDGKVLSLLANEETQPAQVIHTLKPSLRKKGLFIGTWKLSGSVITISNLIDASGRFPIPPISTPGNDQPFARYSFSMILSLSSRPLGRWNKIMMNEYNSVDLENGNTTPLGLRHERPFWFSRVKSFPPF